VATIAAIAAIVAGGIAAAGGTAYGIQTAVEGNWPWEDPEAWLLGHLKAETGGIGQIISSAQGEPTLMEQLKGGGEQSQGSGTAGVLAGATGQGVAKAAELAMGQTPQQQQAGVSRPMPGQTPVSSGGPSRFDALADEWDSKPDRGKILGGAAKDIGIGLVGNAASFALPYVGQALGSIGQAATTGASVAGQTAGGAGSAVAQGVNASAPTLASTLVNAGKQAATSGLTGAGMGAARAAIKGEDVGPAALSGLASGIVSNLGARAFNAGFPSEVGYGAPTRGMFSSAEGPMTSFRPSITATPNSSYGAMVARPIPRLGSSFAGGAVRTALTPTAPRPPEPMYAHRPMWGEQPYGARWYGAV
jgi:hypothetical protein